MTCDCSCYMLKLWTNSLRKFLVTKGWTLVYSYFWWRTVRSGIIVGYLCMLGLSLKTIPNNSFKRHTIQSYLCSPKAIDHFFAFPLLMMTFSKHGAATCNTAYSLCLSVLIVFFLTAHSPVMLGLLRICFNHLCTVFLFTSCPKEITTQKV